eukprot:g70891.t1
MQSTQPISSLRRGNSRHARTKTMGDVFLQHIGAIPHTPEALRTAVAAQPSPALVSQAPAPAKAKSIPVVASQAKSTPVSAKTTSISVTPPPPTSAAPAPPSDREASPTGRGPVAPLPTSSPPAVPTPTSVKKTGNTSIKTPTSPDEDDRLNLELQKLHALTGKSKTSPAKPRQSSRSSSRSGSRSPGSRSRKASSSPATLVSPKRSEAEVIIHKSPPPNRMAPSPANARQVVPRNSSGFHRPVSGERHVRNSATRSSKKGASRSSQQGPSPNIRAALLESSPPSTLPSLADALPAATRSRTPSSTRKVAPSATVTPSRKPIAANPKSSPDSPLPAPFDDSAWFDEESRDESED